MVGKPKMGDIRQLRPSTYILDCGQPIKEYLKSIQHYHSKIGDAVVWVRYGKAPRNMLRKGPYPVAVGPTRESVELKERTK